MNGKQGKTQVNVKGENSIVFAGKKCMISINPDTEEIIQTNPHTRREKNDKDK